MIIDYNYWLELSDKSFQILIWTDYDFTNMEFIENFDESMEKGKSLPNNKGVKGKRTKVRTKAELKDMSSPDMSTSDLHKAADSNGM